jgi:hypothetical protein
MNEKILITGETSIKIVNSDHYYAELLGKRIIRQLRPHHYW